MALIAPGVCRFTVNQTFAGQPVANVFDFRIDTTGTVTDRDEAIFIVAGDIINNWDDHVRIRQADDLTCVSVSWVDLNSADGSTGERQVTSATTWPAVGGGGSAPFSANVAVLVHKQLENSQRNRRNGRFFLCGGAETWTTAGAPNVVDATTRATLNADMVDFLNGVNDDNPTVSRGMVVVHTRNVAPPGQPVELEYTGRSDVGALIVQSLLATQRRRLR